MKVFAALLFFTISGAVFAQETRQPMVIADLSEPNEVQAWRFFTDQVMGGVSTGAVRIDGEALHLSGTVSTANRGGFIQAQRAVDPLPDKTTALRLRTRGDGQVYYIHLRTRATRLPWQYYQAAFTTTSTWQDVTLPLDAFEPSGPLLPSAPRPDTVRSVALVAYGRDHVASVSLSQITALP